MRRLRDDEAGLIDGLLYDDQMRAWLSGKPLLPDVLGDDDDSGAAVTEVATGEVVFEKGELGDCMYLVLDGAVRVHDNGTTLAQLGANTVFGEFTVLHQGERTASVTAEEDSYLLRLTQADLYDLIREEATVAQSLIKLIVRRLRQNQSTRSQQGAAQTS